MSFCYGDHFSRELRVRLQIKRHQVLGKVCWNVRSSLRPVSDIWMSWRTTWHSHEALDTLALHCCVKCTAFNHGLLSVCVSHSQSGYWFFLSVHHLFCFLISWHRKPKCFHESVLKLTGASAVFSTSSPGSPAPIAYSGSLDSLICISKRRAKDNGQLRADGNCTSRHSDSLCD